MTSGLIPKGEYPETQSLGIQDMLKQNKSSSFISTQQVFPKDAAFLCAKHWNPDRTIRFLNNSNLNGDLNR